MPSDRGMNIQIGGASAMAPVVDPVCDLYDAVFSRPPFFWRDDESQLHRERLERLLGDPTFGAALAWHQDRLVGFAYGYTLPTETQHWKSLTKPIAAETTEEWPGRTFVLFDFAVEAVERGRGIGRLLHNQLLASRNEERATLTVQPTAAETKKLYERWGWEKVGQLDGGLAGAAPVFDVYLRRSLRGLG